MNAGVITIWRKLAMNARAITIRRRRAMPAWALTIRRVRAMPARALTVAVAAAAALALSACGVGGRQAAPASQFDLGPEPGGALSGTPRGPIAFSFGAAPMLNDTGVIWRIGDSPEPHSYATYRWAVSPAQLVRQRLMDRLSHDGPVLSADGGGLPVLQVTLTRFEQDYSANGSSSEGQVVMRVLLTNGAKVESAQFARSVPATAQDAAAGVVALRSAVDQASDQIAAWIAQRVPPAR
jgi:cholesterol transport system auxiliary component